MKGYYINNFDIELSVLVYIGIRYDKIYIYLIKFINVFDEMN